MLDVLQITEAQRECCSSRYLHSRLPNKAMFLLTSPPNAKQLNFLLRETVFQLIRCGFDSRCALHRNWFEVYLYPPRPPFDTFK